MERYTPPLLLFIKNDNNIYKRKNPNFPSLIRLESTTALQETDIADVEVWIDRHFMLSSVAMVSTLAGIWLPPLKYISIAALAYLTIPMAQRSYRGLVEQHRLKVDVINLVTLPLMIVSGYLPAAALGYWL